MSAIQQGIMGIVDLLLGGLLAGLLLRRMYRLCWAFPVYLGVVLVTDLLMLGSPRRFYTADFWILKEVVHNVLKFAIALELGVRTFRAFPTARATARRLVFAVLLATYLAVVALRPEGHRDYLTLANDLQPRVINGSIWLFTALAIVILWYRLPVNPLHKVILIGFVPYLLVFTTGLSVVRSFGWEVRLLGGYFYTIAYLTLLVYWNYAVWHAIRSPRMITPRAPGLVETVPPATTAGDSSGY